MTIEKEAKDIWNRLCGYRTAKKEKPYLLISAALQTKQDRIEELEFIINSDVPFGTMLINAQTKVKEIEQESKSRMDKIVYAKAEIRRCYDKINELESALKPFIENYDKYGKHGPFAHGLFERAKKAIGGGNAGD